MWIKRLEKKLQTNWSKLEFLLGEEWKETTLGKDIGVKVDNFL